MTKVYFGLRRSGSRAESTESPLISPPITITEAAARLHRNRNWIAGACSALGIVLQPGGTSRLMSERDFARLQKHDAKARQEEAERKTQ
jgi:hypothetical protein